jgi:hypothetical protein
MYCMARTISGGRLVGICHNRAVLLRPEANGFGLKIPPPVQSNTRRMMLVAYMASLAEPPVVVNWLLVVVTRPFVFVPARQTNINYLIHPSQSKPLKIILKVGILKDQSNGLSERGREGFVNCLLIGGGGRCSTLGHKFDAKYSTQRSCLIVRVRTNCTKVLNTLAWIKGGILGP